MSIFDRLWGGGRKTAPQPKATTPAALSAEDSDTPGSVDRRIRPRKNACKGTKALIIDDERLARNELKKLLMEFPEIEVIGEAPTRASSPASATPTPMRSCTRPGSPRSG